MNYSVSIDVPDLEDGLAFYRDALGLPEVARPVPTYVILKCGDAQIGLIEKAARRRPSPSAVIRSAMASACWGRVPERHVPAHFTKQFVSTQFLAVERAGRTLLG